MVAVQPSRSTPGGPIDCHAHVFLASLPMAADVRYRPSADAPLDAYIAHLDANAMAGGVLVQVSFLSTDNGFLLDALARHPQRLRGVAVVDREVPASELARLAARGVRGLRLNLLGRDLPDFEESHWRTHLDAIGAAGLHLEIQSESAAWPAILPALLPSGVGLVIDHFGRPRQADPAQDPGFAAVLAAAALPQVWVKLSGHYRFTADAGQAARALLDRAGPSRLLWGSDWPWTQHPEITDYAALKASLDGWVGDGRIVRRILCDNAAALYWR